MLTRMATEIVRWCDQHMRLDETSRVPAAQVTLTIQGSGPYSLDLCPDCDGDLIEPLRSLVAKDGVKIASHTPPPAGGRGQARQAPTRQEAKLPCPLCMASYASMVGLLGHLRGGAHDIPVEGSGWQDVYGPTCPICGIDVPERHIWREHDLKAGDVSAALTAQQRDAWLEGAAKHLGSL